MAGCVCFSCVHHNERKTHGCFGSFPRHEQHGLGTQRAEIRQTNWANLTQIFNTIFCDVRLPVAGQIHPTAIDFRGIFALMLAFLCLEKAEKSALFAILSKIQLHVKKSIQRKASQGRPTCVPIIRPSRGRMQRAQKNKKQSKPNENI
jgi:hypothetical protein